MSKSIKFEVVIVGLIVLAAAQFALAGDWYGRPYGPPVGPVAVVGSAPAPGYAVVVKQGDLEIAPGSTLQLSATNFGAEPGAVSLRLDSNVSLKGEIKVWSPTCVTVKLPDVAINGWAGAWIEVHQAKGPLVKVFRVNLVAKPDLVVLQNGGGVTEVTTIVGGAPAPKTEAPKPAATTTASDVPPSPIANVSE